MSESLRDASSFHRTLPGAAGQMVTSEEVSAYLAFLEERYPLLIEVLDRVERELIREGVDLSRLAEGDLSAFETPTSKPGSDTAPHT